MSGELPRREVYSSEVLQETPPTKQSFSEWLVHSIRPYSAQERAEHEAINEAVLEQELIHVDPKEIEKAPIGNFGEGFTHHADTHFKSGDKPVTAPLTIEEMRIFLGHGIPDALRSFILQRFEFRYHENSSDHERDQDGYEDNRLVNDIFSEDGKIVLDLNFNSFYSRREGDAHSFADKRIKDPERGKWLSGLVDSSKLSLIIGKIMAQIIPPPTDDTGKPWNELLPAGFKVMKHRGDVPLDPESAVKQQWEDFVALAVANPTEAEAKAPQLYAHYLQQIQDFRQIERQDDAFDNLSEKLEQGTVNFTDFIIVYDLRSEEEKRQAAVGDGRSAQTAWYDKMAEWMNKNVLFLFGRKMIFDLPEDPERVFQREHDKGEIAKLLEQYRCEDRDKIFGETLQRGSHATGFSKLHLRTKARQILIANSQSSDFSEWRVIAYLHVFDDLFKATNGYEISKESYEDLRTVHNTSAGAGKRHGTDYVMWKAVAITGPHIPGQRFRYILKDRADYIEQVEGKIAEKSDDMLNKMPVDGLDQCLDGLIDFDQRFNSHAPNGLRVVYGNLSDPDLLGEHLAHEIAEKYLEKWAIPIISPDTQAILRRLKAYIDKKKGVPDKALSSQFVKMVGRYSSSLDRPVLKDAETLLSVPAKTLISSGDIGLISRQVSQANNICDASFKGVERALETVVGGKPLYLLHPKTKSNLVLLLKEGKTDRAKLINTLMAAARGSDGKEGYIHGETPEATDLQLRREESNLESFLYSTDPNITKNLDIIHDVSEYRKELEPGLVNCVDHAAENLGRMENATHLLATAGDWQAYGSQLEKAGILGKEDKATVTANGEKLRQAKIDEFAQSCFPLGDHDDHGGHGTRLTPEELQERDGHVAFVAKGFQDLAARLDAKVDTTEQHQRYEALATEIVVRRTKKEDAKPSAALIKAVADATAEIQRQAPLAERNFVAERITKANDSQRLAFLREIVQKCLGGNDPYSLLVQLNAGTGTYKERVETWLNGNGALFTIPPLDVAVANKLRSAAETMDEDSAAGGYQFQKVIAEIRTTCDYIVGAAAAEAPAEKK